MFGAIDILLKRFVTLMILAIILIGYLFNVVITYGN